MIEGKRISLYIHYVTFGIYYAIIACGNVFFSLQFLEAVYERNRTTLLRIKDSSGCSSSRDVCGVAEAAEPA